MGRSKRRRGDGTGRAAPRLGLAAIVAASALLVAGAAAVPPSVEREWVPAWRDGNAETPHAQLPAAQPQPRDPRRRDAPGGGQRRMVQQPDDRQSREMDQGDAPAVAAHMTVADPATLGGARAEEVYQAIRVAMRDSYTQAGDPVTQAYQRWHRYNATPYRSTLHGQRFVNVYGNSQARGYGRFEKAGTMPEGAMLAMDSFVVTESGQVMTGPFFLMEKRERGFDATTGDWLYMMVGADGEMVGITNGEGSARVGFCAGCHRGAPEGQAGLWLIPEAFRKK